MDLASAQNAFISLVTSLEPQDRPEFLTFCKDYLLNDLSDNKAYFDLRTIAEDIKSLVPTEAIFPSEQINHSNIGNLPQTGNEPIIHVDSFLFEDDQIDALVEEGKLSRNYCKNCGSIDAYYCSAASKIIGVEINQDLCTLQNHIIDKYNLRDRIQVICNNVCNLPEVVHAANVIILNNVFECFMPKETQKQIWVWLKKHITSGTILITVPSMEETLSSLETGIDISSWLKKIPITDPVAVLKMDDQDLLSEICSYVVI
ncbi:UNVERIFIED_CONTAM: hypothetical protein NCL1_36992 [Trichonephila clavipes]